MPDIKSPTPYLADDHRKNDRSFDSSHGFCAHWRMDRKSHYHRW